MYRVYEVYTWDDVTYTEVSAYDNQADAEKECEKLKVERISHNYKPDPVTYTVMSDLQYSLLMNDH